MSTKDAQDFVKKNYGMTASISGVNSDNYKDGNRDETIATAYKDRDFLAKFSMLNVNNQNLRITVNENENSISSQWKETDANPKPTDLEKIVSTTNNYSIQHNYNPNTFLYSNYGKSSRMSGIIPFSWFTNKYYASHSSIAAKSNAELYRYEVGRDFKVSLKYEF